MTKSQTTPATIHRALGDIDAGQWDACANPPSRPFDPFVSHAFLSALEESGSVAAGTGWQPCHIAIPGDAGRLAAVMPLYLKSHSLGEYVFDHAFADALHRAGGRYYPKLQCAVPFTPVPGRRLLVADGGDVPALERRLAQAAVALAGQRACSSLHLTFLSEPEWTHLGRLGFLQRTDHQYHWLNEGYRTFDDFLGALASRKRKAIRKERQQALAGGLEIRHLSGRDITEAHWDRFFEFYMDTGARKWGHPYLNRRFFSLIGERLSDRCLLVLAMNGSEAVAGALNLIGGDCLYGRYWGAIGSYACLHFEVCYYQAIDYAIAHGLARVEAGAQGEHKLTRGYRPVTTYSAHWFANTSLARAVGDYLAYERDEIRQAQRILAAAGPFRKGARATDKT